MHSYLTVTDTGSVILQQILKVKFWFSTAQIISSYIKVFQLHVIFVQLTTAYQLLPMTSDNAKFYERFIPDKPVM